MKAIIWERPTFQFPLAAAFVLIYGFSLKFSRFLCSCFSPSSFHPNVSIACRFRDRGCVELCEIDFLLKILLIESAASPLWRLVIWTPICTKTESSQSHESRAQPADSLKACSKPKATNFCSNTQFCCIFSRTWYVQKFDTLSQNSSSNLVFLWLKAQSIGCLTGSFYAEDIPNSFQHFFCRDEEFCGSMLPLTGDVRRTGGEHTFSLETNITGWKKENPCLFDAFITL